MNVNLHTELIPPAEIVKDGSTSLANYIDVGAAYAELFAQYLDLRPDMAVLEMGSAAGRISRQFINILSPQGRFTGIDVMPEPVRWCNAAIGARFPNFHFLHADIYNSEYNPGGGVKASAYRFPFDDASLDLVVLTSVFTHMLRNDVKRYLDEIARTLKPGGSCFATFYLYTRDALGRIGAADSNPRFLFPLYVVQAVPVCVCADNEDLEEAVAYERNFLLGMASASGLEEALFLPGQWLHGAEGRAAGQDAVVFRK